MACTHSEFTVQALQVAARALPQRQLFLHATQEALTAQNLGKTRQPPHPTAPSHPGSKHAPGFGVLIKDGRPTPVCVPVLHKAAGPQPQMVSGKL